MMYMMYGPEPELTPHCVCICAVWGRVSKFHPSWTCWICWTDSIRLITAHTPSLSLSRVTIRAVRSEMSKPSRKYIPLQSEPHMIIRAVGVGDVCVFLSLAGVND